MRKSLYQFIDIAPCESYTGNFYFSFVFSLDEDGDVLGWFLIIMVGLIRINPEETISTYKGGSWGMIS